MRSVDKQVMTFLRHSFRTGRFNFSCIQGATSALDVLNRCIGLYLDPTLALKINKITAIPISPTRKRLVKGTLVSMNKGARIGAIMETYNNVHGNSELWVYDLMTGHSEYIRIRDLKLATTNCIAKPLDLRLVAYTLTGLPMGNIIPQDKPVDITHRSTDMFKFANTWYRIVSASPTPQEPERLAALRARLLSALAEQLENRSVGLFTSALAELVAQQQPRANSDFIEGLAMLSAIQETVPAKTISIVSNFSFSSPVFATPWPFRITYIRTYGGTKYKLPAKFDLSCADTSLLFTVYVDTKKQICILRPLDFYTKHKEGYQQFLHYHSYHRGVMCLGSLGELVVSFGTERSQLVSAVQDYFNRLTVAVQGVNLGSPAIARPRESWPSTSDLCDATQVLSPCKTFTKEGSNA